jgi:hypothetical protein
MKTLKARLLPFIAVLVLATACVVPQAYVVPAGTPAPTTDAPRTFAPQGILAASNTAAQRVALFGNTGVGALNTAGPVFQIPDYKTVELQWSLAVSGTRTVIVALQGNTLAANSSAAAADISTSAWVTTTILTVVGTSATATGGLTGTLALHGYFVRVNVSLTDTAPYTLTVLGVIQP